MVDLTIQHKRSSQSGKRPTTAQLELGELAVNTYDGTLYLKKNVEGEETVVALFSSVGGTTIEWPDVLNTPNTVQGYGITDAFSGDYDDLTDKPDLTIYQLAEQAFDGDYNSLVNKPQLFDGLFDSLGNKPTTIAGYGITDALTGEYSELANTPFIPSDVTDLTDTTGLIFSGAYADLTGKPTLVVNLSDLGDVSNTAPSTGEVLKWNGSSWGPGADTGDTNADTLDGQHGTYYLEYSNFANTPFVPTSLTDLSIADGPANYVLKTNGSGLFSFTKGIDDLSVTVAGSPSGSGLLQYDVANSVFTFTPPDLTPYVTGPGGNVNEVQFNDGAGSFTASSDLTFDANTTQLSVGTTLGSVAVSTIKGPELAQALVIQSYSGSAYAPHVVFDNTAGVVTDFADGSTVDFTNVTVTGTNFLTAETDTLASVTVRGNTTSQTCVIPFAYANEANFPNASTSGGAIAISNATKEAFFATGGDWLPLQNRGNEAYDNFGTSTTYNPGGAVTHGSYIRNEADTADVAASVTVTSGFSKVKVELDASIANLTDSTTEMVIALERTVDGSNATTVKTFLFPVANTFYGSQHFLYIDTHGANAGSTVEYKLKVDMSAYSNESARVQYGICGDTLYIKEIA
jgi:hypothetical protein